MIQTRLLQYFLAVAEEQSITKAAEYLHISQPTLSKQMMDLEEALGRQLLIRGRKKVTLTEEGTFLLEQSALRRGGGSDCADVLSGRVGGSG